jgi:hypothetical protein
MNDRNIPPHILSKSINSLNNYAEMNTEQSKLNSHAIVHGSKTGSSRLNNNDKTQAPPQPKVSETPSFKYVQPNFATTLPLHYAQVPEHVNAATPFHYQQNQHSTT